MSVKIKRITLWRTEVENEPGVLARTLEPLAGAGWDLEVVMGYPETGDKAAIEIYPIAGKKAVAAAQAAGLTASSIPTLLVEGDNRAGLGHVIARAIGDAGINAGFLVALIVGRRYSAVVGFHSDEDAKTAAALIKKATAVKRK